MYLLAVYEAGSMDTFVRTSQRDWEVNQRPSPKHFSACPRGLGYIEDFLKDKEGWLKH